MKFDIPFIVYDPADFVMPKGNAKFQAIVSAALHRAHLRTRCAEAQNWRCCYCHKPMSLENGHKMSVTLEHVTPISKGGGDDYESCAAACKRCNNRRGNRELSEDMTQFISEPKDPARGLRRRVKRALRIIEEGRDIEPWVKSQHLSKERQELFYKMLKDAQGE